MYVNMKYEIDEKIGISKDAPFARSPSNEIRYRRKT